MAEKTAKKVRLRVLTPDKVVLDDDFDMVVFRTTTGDKGVMPGHESYSASLDVGDVRAFSQGKEVKKLTALGGLVNVRGDKVVIMSQIADEPERIDAAIAEVARKRAENKQAEVVADAEMHRIEAALRRALVRNDLSSFAIIKGNLEKGDE